MSRSTGRTGRYGFVLTSPRPVVTLDSMADDEPDPGGDTEMFRAFVQSEAKYEPRPGPRGPFIVVGVALLIAVIAFFIIISSR